MGLFKKPNRKFRQREARTDSEDENTTTEPSDKDRSLSKLDTKVSTDTEASSTPSVSSSSGSATKEKEDKTESIPKPSNLLSFHDDEEDGEVFKLKKSNYSRRLAKQREREKKKREESSSSAVKEPPKEESKVSESKTQNKSKVSSKDNWNILSGNDAEDMEVESEDEKSNPFKNVLQSGIIPDAATIYAMKKHRQMAREMGDFIPVEEPEKEEEKSRLIRDDDNDRSDDDEDDEPSRMSFTINTGAVERQKIRETFLSLQEGSGNDLETEEAAELDRWEQEQIRKGVGIAQVGPQNPPVSEEQLYTYPSVVNIPSAVEDTNLKNPVTAPNNPPLLDNLIKKSEGNLTTSDVKSRLEERLSTLKTIHKAHEQELADCEKELIESSELVAKLELEAPERARNFSLYQQMSGYVKDLVECLDLKVAHIELLDGRMMDMFKTRAQKLVSRRQQDIRDQSDEFSTLSSEILKGVSAEFLSEKNICTDEIKLRRAAEREGRRMRRRKKRERLMMIVKHQDGMSSDDEQPDVDMVKFKQTRDAIIEEAGTVFEDVVEEFGSLEGVMASFEKWKFARPNTYTEAFVPMCLPKIFGIFIKFALLPWNPLEEDIDFESKNWFHQIVCYGCGNLKTLEEGTDDPDINLIPGIMEKVILPKITGFIQNVWDPLSSSQTTRLVHLIKTLYSNYPSINGKSKQLQTCLKAVSTRILKSLDDDVFIPLYPKELLENRSLGAVDFFQRQFWSSVKLLQNILLWEDLIAEQPLQQLSLGSLLNRYLLMGLHTSMLMRDTLDKCKAIVSIFPKSWFKNSKGTTTLPLLKQFSAFLMKYADSFHSQCVKRGLPEEEAKDAVKEMVQLLVSIESLEDAVSIAKKYHVSAFKS